MKGCRANICKRSLRIALTLLGITLASSGSAQPTGKVALKEFVYRDEHPEKYKWKKVLTVPGRIIFSNSIACSDSVIYSFGGFDTRVVQREVNMIKEGNFSKTTIQYPGKGFINNIFFISDSLLFAGGGLDSNKAVYNEQDFWQYNVNTNTWKRLKNIPFYYRTSPAVYHTNGSIVAMVTQLDGDGFRHTTVQFYTYDVANDSWMLQRSENEIPDYSDPVSFYVDDNAYVLFQRDQLYRKPANLFYKFNFSTRLWTKLVSFPGRERILAFATSDARYGYLGGGILGSSSVNASDMYRYDPVLEQWQQCRNLPKAIRWGKAWFFNNSIYAGFGIHGDDEQISIWKLMPVN